MKRPQAAGKRTAAQRLPAARHLQGHIARKRFGQHFLADTSVIDGIVKEIEVGDVYLGTVVGIKEFGAFINLKPGTDGLLHISRIANKRVEKVEDVLSMGEQVLVRVIDIDPKSGKISLTRKDMLPPDKD